MTKRRRKDRDAAAQWNQLELGIPGISGLINRRSMERVIYPPAKPPKNERGQIAPVEKKA